ncbi:MAG: alpha-2-macroglobulin [Chitinophagaceae bacterium]|nr:MAG: alpha-2-macroglobulin [Chitinophagaceae bacterium]
MNTLRRTGALLLLLFTAANAIAQTKFNYAVSWRRVDSLYYTLSQPKAALRLTDSIYTVARNQRNEPELLRALFYRGLLQRENREESSVKAIAALEAELPRLRGASRALLQSMIAEEYKLYVNQNIYQLYNRRPAADTSKDIRTWSLPQLHTRIRQLYRASLQPAALLQKTPLDGYETLIEKGNARSLRPTLYDLLAHAALEYHRYLSPYPVPENAFVLSTPEAFGAPETFIRIRFRSPDTASGILHALQLYQELIRLHLHTRNRDALEDVDASRLEFVHYQYSGGDRDSLYKRALQERIAGEGNSPAMSARLKLAQLHFQQAAGYDPLKDTTRRWDYNKALALLAPAVADTSRREQAWVSAYNLAAQIRKASVRLQVEKVNLPGQPFRFLAEYRNTGRAWFRIIAIPDASRLELRERSDWDSLYRQQPLRQWSEALPPTGDAQTHRVELKADALPVGTYLLCASNTQGFSGDSSAVAGALIYVSGIAYIHNGSELRIVNRESGAPLPAAEAQIYRTNSDRYYRRDRDVMQLSAAGSYRADAEGFLHAPLSGNWSVRYALKIKWGNDSLFQSAQQDLFYWPENHGDYGAANPQVYFFTDRSIYRPGQIVYFKGIVLNRLGRNSNIVAGQTKQVRLIDVNGKVQASMEVTTNEWGSFNGRFTLPQGGLGGVFSIQPDYGWYGNAQFSVEEYKRPKFEVRFDTVKAEYKAGDAVQLRAIAKAYAGNPVGNARVRYRVTRRQQIPWWWWYDGGNRRNEAEIAHGEVVTGADGSFTIPFTAAPDLSIAPESGPTWTFEVSADVTDINGETRSGKTALNIGYNALQLQIPSTARVHIDSFTRIPASLTNTNGQPLKLPVMATLTRLKTNDRLLRPRLWERPDQFVIDSTDFVRLFPNDPYGAEADIQQWPALEVAASFTDTVATGGLVLPAATRLVPGFYEIMLSVRDRAGKEVRVKRRIELYQTGRSNRPEYLSAESSLAAAEPGQTPLVRIRTSSRLQLLTTIQRPTDTLAAGYRRLMALDSAAAIPVPVAEADRGGVRVAAYAVRHNRLHSATVAVDVPWTNKQLQVRVGTFRDKTLPGSTERWSLQVSGIKGERVAAELLASMYDVSLDQLKEHRWMPPSLWPQNYYRYAWTGYENFVARRSEGFDAEPAPRSVPTKTYDVPVYAQQVEWQKRERLMLRRDDGSGADGSTAMAAPAAAMKEVGYSTSRVSADEVVVTANGNAPKENAPSPETAAQPPAPRRNFQETAFFFPDLRTDSAGNVSFSFTLPESLTRWRMQALAHTQGLAFGMTTAELTAQKELMVQPNLPRFLREGDHFEISTKVVNLSGKEITGQAQLELFDAATGVPVDGWFQNFFPNQFFTVAPGGSEAVVFPVEVPYLYNKALTWRITARSGNVSDAEEASLPILSNRIMVTETMPLPMRGAGTKTFNFEKLLRSAGKESLQHQSLTFEYTPNPAWYAVQALPYLFAYPFECAEQTWNRYYANSLGSYIVEHTPRLREVFRTWQTKDTAALLSNLEKNEELKSALLEETPWVLQARNESQRKRDVALLFEISRLSSGLQHALSRLREMQLSDGSFPWFPGGRGNRYITQYIVTGMGHLERLGVDGSAYADIRQRALAFLDRQIAEDYSELKKRKVDLDKQQASDFQVQYLYARSFTGEKPPAAGDAFAYYLGQANRYWPAFTKRSQAMSALVLSRYGRKKEAGAVIQSLRETAVRDEELGMYWKDNRFGYSWHWWYAPIETQALMVEAFLEVAGDKAAADDLRTWLVKNKQTSNWHSTIATADACYALLLQGSDWIGSSPRVTISAGPLRLSSDSLGEAGTGYFKKTIPGDLVRSDMGRVIVKVQAPTGVAGYNAPSWGAVYWQYFEDMDKITAATSPLRIERKIFQEVNKGRGPELVPISAETPVHVGDKVRVRLVLRTDRAMEYVHLKDLRPSCIEPVSVLSGYRWQEGLGYYEQTRDISTNFFIDYLPRGTYVLEYTAFVTNKGQFSAGLATAQCLYTPEFAAHSEGQQLTVE